MANTPITVHTTFTAADGYASWNQVFSRRRTPPNTLSAANAREVPLSRPTETSAYGTTTAAAPTHPKPSTNCGWGRDRELKI